MPLIPEWLRPKRTPAWNQAILLAAVALRMVLGLALTFVLGRFLSPASFGDFALVATVFGFAREFTEIGTGNVAVRAAAQEHADERGVLEHLLGLRLILCLAAAFACALFAVARTHGILQGMLLAAAAVLTVSYLSGLSVAFQLRQAQFAPSAFFVLVQILTLGAVALLFALHVDGGWFGGVVVGRETIGLIGATILAVRLLGYAPSPRFTRSGFRSLFGSAAVVALASLAYNFQFLSGLFWVQLLRPEAEVGAFAAAQRPVAAVLIVPWLIMSPLFPIISALAARNRTEFRRQAKATIDVSLGLGAVMWVAIMQTAEPLLILLYGSKFSTGPLSAVATLSWFALPLGGSFLAAAVSTVLIADHREDALLTLGVVGCVLFVALNIALLPAVGFYGSAAATAFSVSVINAGGMVLAAVRGIPPGFRTALILLPAALLFSVLSLLPDDPPLVRLALASLLVFAALAGVWFFPGIPASRRELAARSQEVAKAHRERVTTHLEGGTSG